MASDLQHLKALLNRWDVAYDEILYDNKHKTYGDVDQVILIEVHSGSCAKAQGYGGFFTQYVFNMDGTFKEMGAWE